MNDAIVHHETIICKYKSSWFYLHLKYQNINSQHEYAQPLGYNSQITDACWSKVKGQRIFIIWSSNLLVQTELQYHY